MVRVALILSVALSLGLVGCGGKKTNGTGPTGGRQDRNRVSEEDQARLEEARRAAEAAEQELSDLRLERQQLEGEQ
jgi:hypothetical protein